MPDAPSAAEVAFSPEQFGRALGGSAFAFRGYNVTNLGRTPELLAIERYAPILQSYLQRASDLCTDVKGRPVDLPRRVRERRDTSLATYDEAICLIVAVEMAQLELLRTHFNIDVSRAKVAYGFSLGEVAALVAGGVLELEDALRIPLEMSDDCVALSDDVTLGVVFSRRGSLDESAVRRVCQEVNFAGDGVVGVSAYLAPNSLLLIGQRTALDRFAARRAELSQERVYLRRNEHRWPPLHTPIVWERNVVNRSQYHMHGMPTKLAPPSLRLFSLVTGSVAYDGTNTRELIGKWVDHPQRLWNAVEHTLADGVDTVVHVGPQPNIIPATFDRLALNVRNQTKDHVGMRALSGMVRRPWLQNILPKRTALLRAPHLRHIRLEDWLLEHADA